jgi:ATP-dependent Lhr-like helicase
MLLLPLTDDDSAKAAVLEAFAELASPAAFGARIRGALAGSGTFGAAFRENAGRALLLPRSGFGKRTPLWVTRLRAKRLYEKTGGYEDFPIVVETWKTVLEGRFDLATATALFAGIADGSVSLSFFNPPVPSPFARQAGWAETNRFLYEGDELPGAGNIRPVDNGTTAGGYGGSAGDRAIENAMTHATARPAIPQDLALELGRKLRRELPGWAPESPLALADWVDERVLVPADEWEALLAACPEELRAVAADLPGIASARLPGARTDVVVNKSRLQGLAAGIEADPARMMAEWLRSTGPTPLGRLSLIFGLPDEAAVSSALERAASVVPGDLGTMGGERGVAGACDRDVLESLLRRTRKAARPTIRSLPARDLPAFVATVQGLRDRRAAPPGQGMRAGHDAVDASDSAGIAATRRALAALSGFPAAASLWETELLPARVAGYRPEYLDQILGSGEFIWFGAGQQTLAFVARGDYEAFARGAASALLRPGEPPLDAWAIKDRSGLSIAEFEDAVWREAWDGAISSDSFEAVRRAATEGFRRVAYSGQAPRDDARPGYPGVSGPEGQRSQGHGRVPLAIRGRWKAGAPVAGNWFSLALDDGTGREGASRDEADALELSMGAVRAMVRRYGILCRALLERELPQAGWAASFQALRRLELSGELVSGRFFDGIDGLQFIGREALAVYVGGGFGGLLWSANACDPASPAGLSVGGLPDRVPSRLPVNRISMRGGDPVCVSRRSWRDLELALAPDDQDLAPALGFIVEARRRPVSPEQRIVVSTVNGEPATRSPYTGALAALGFDADRDSMTLW